MKSPSPDTLSVVEMQNVDGCIAGEWERHLLNHRQLGKS